MLILGIVAGTIVISGSVAQPPSSDMNPAAELQARQEQNAKQFAEFKIALLRLAQKLQRSDKAEDQERAKVIFAAIDLAAKENVEEQFRRLMGGMTKAGGNVAAVNDLLKDDAQLTKTLQEILTILMTDDETARVKAEIAKLEAFLKEAKDLKRRQEILRALNEAQKQSAEKLSKSQRDLALQTKDLADRMDPKPSRSTPADKSDPKNRAPDTKQPSNPKDDPSNRENAQSEDKPSQDGPRDDKIPDGQRPNDGKSSPKNGKDQDSRPDPKPSAPQKPSDAKDSPPNAGESAQKPPSESLPPAPAQAGSQQQQGPPTPGRKQIQEAYPKQNDAAEKMQQNQRPEASRPQDEAIKKLEEAVRELEKRLKQLREEEMLKLLANLEARVKRMLVLQIEVYEATKAIDATVTRNNGVKDTPEVQKSQQQADKEGEIVAEADRALKLLESEGTAVAFARVLEEVRVDMSAVQRRLGLAEVGADTQEIEANIIAMLKEMAEALKKAQQELHQQQQQQAPPPGGQQGPQQLINLLQELRLIRSMQVQVNTRTKMYGDKEKTEQANDPMIREEIRQLSIRQAKLQEMVNKIATGANQ
jgi:hypothetical protein